jgi:RNA polymerase sigma-70 factor (ECF subfamily)
VPERSQDNAASSPPAPGAGQPAAAFAAANDEALLRGMAAGEAGAFDELFARHSRAVMSFLSRLTAGDSEDLLQETFLRVLTHAGDFRPGAAFRPWLFAIARNVAYNAMQKRKLRAEVEVQTDFGGGSAGLRAGTEASATDPSARLVSQERKARLLAALEELPAPQREVIILVIFNGFSYQEAAAVTGDSEGTLRSRVFHALKRLRDRLKEPS